MNHTILLGCIAGSILLSSSESFMMDNKLLTDSQSLQDGSRSSDAPLTPRKTALYKSYSALRQQAEKTENAELKKAILEQFKKNHAAYKAGASTFVEQVDSPLKQILASQLPPNSLNPNELKPLPVTTPQFPASGAHRSPHKKGLLNFLRCCCCAQEEVSPKEDDEVLKEN